MVLLQLGCVLALSATLACGSYVMTFPRSWTSGTSQVCVTVRDPAAPPGTLNLTMTKKVWNQYEDVLSLGHAIIQVPEGTTDSCQEVSIATTEQYNVELHVLGTLGGAKVNRTLLLHMKQSKEVTFIQTDKFLYKPGHNVKIRILTLQGAEMRVSTDQYLKVWVASPGGTRIVQWSDVDNTAGILHLDFDLADEPEKGIYTIHVKTQKGKTERRSFEVKEFVLPRFEVSVKTPRYSLATDETFTFTVCANYTYGQPVRGALSLTVDNNGRNKCSANVVKNVTISGCSDVEVTSKEMKVINCKVNHLAADVVVEEEGTGVRMSAGGHVSVRRTAVSFRTLYEDRYVRPNLPYILKLRAELPDGSPAAGVPVEVCAAGRCTNMTTAPDGLFTTILPSYETNSVFMKTLNCRASMRQSEFSKDLDHYFSPSNSSLLIHAPEGKVKCVSGEAQNHLLTVFFSASDLTSAVFTVQVVSRGKIQYQGSKEYQLASGELPISVEHLVEPLPPPLPNTIRGVVNINVNLPPTASPKVKVLVWYTRKDGEVVADTRELEVDKCLGTTVNLTWSTSRVQPGEQASLSLSSEPDSVCSLGVVDRSSELLTKDPDPITLETIFESLADYDIPSWHNSQIDTHTYCREKGRIEMDARDGHGPLIVYPPGSFYSDYVDALTMFNDAGVYVVSDETLETRPCEERVERHYSMVAYNMGGVHGDYLSRSAGFPAHRTMAMAPTMTDSLHVGASTLPEPVDAADAAPRTNFPETWLWDILVVPSSGVRSQNLTLPDTITQWVGKAVCAHPQKGVGLSQRESITTFTPFFVDLTLPPTVKRGEILPVKMSVFNYLGEPIPVTVEVRESADYEVLAEAGEHGGPGRRSSCVPAQDKVVHTVRIKPQEIGDVNITVAAFVDHEYSHPCGSGDTSIDRRDAVIKAIKVEAEGFLREVAETKYICSTELETGEDSLESWELTTPDDIVEGSARAWITAVGDLLALSLENLGHLIRMPSGCGEQNMVNFVPNIFIMQYLKASRQTTPETTSKLLTFMKTGYQRELLYLRYDGSFSAFGSADDSGSTWLTAFVLKSFAQAEEYILIDKKRLNRTSTWLRKQQGIDGCYTSVGKVFNKAMKGGIAGSESAVPLTAYVVMALLEAGEDLCDTTQCQVAQCLLADTSQDTYTLALKAYALALAKLPEAEETLQQLLNQAVVAKNSTHWQLTKESGQSRGIGVEIAGYAIMAMMTLDPERYRQQATKVVKWITSQRNGQGGFYSTQDTVVALQALALFETHSYQGPMNVVATVRATGLVQPLTVTDDNKLLEQLVRLPTLPTTVTITMDGHGCLVLQGVLRYNIPEAEASDAFVMTVNTVTARDDKCVKKRITVCASYLLPDGKSNMAVIEVDLVSGYIPEKEDLKKLVREEINVKRYDVDGSKVAFYIEELTASNTCVKFRVIRDIEVENVKPGTVRLYDYYQPEFQISKTYTLPPPNDCA